MSFSAPPPVIILVRPQLGENIGMCARAMLNCNVNELRIVAPRDGWPNPSAVSAASGAVSVLDTAQIFNTTEKAVADLDFIFATTARRRDIVKEVYTIGTAAEKIHERRERTGILFGPERTGLENDDVALANAVLNIPLNPEFSSLNLAQAVLLVCYEWMAANTPEKVETITGDTKIATRGEVENLMQRLEERLDNAGFFRSAEKKETTLRNIRNFFFRSTITEQEAQMLHGVFKKLLS